MKQEKNNSPACNSTSEVSGAPSQQDNGPQSKICGVKSSLPSRVQTRSSSSEGKSPRVSSEDTFNLSDKIWHGEQYCKKHHIHEEDVKHHLKAFLDDIIKDWEFCKKADVEPSIHPRRIITYLKKHFGGLVE